MFRDRRKPKVKFVSRSEVVNIVCLYRVEMDPRHNDITNENKWARVLATDESPTGINMEEGEWLVFWGVTHAPWALTNLIMLLH